MQYREERDDKPHEVSRYAECLTCGKPLEYYDHPEQGSWWSHFEHPTDHHEGSPLLHYTDPRLITGSAWWLEVQAHDRDALVQILWRSAMPGWTPIDPEHPDWASYVAEAEAIIERRHECEWREKYANQMNGSMLLVEEVAELKTRIDVARKLAQSSTGEFATRMEIALSEPRA